MEFIAFLAGLGVLILIAWLVGLLKSLKTNQKYRLKNTYLTA
jgi:hypothetical protein